MDTRNGRAVVNVKIYKLTLTPEEWTSIRVESRIFDSRFPLAGEDFGPDWFKDRKFFDSELWSLACGQGVEDAQELAREIFAPVVGPTTADALECYQEGRSGGWLYVEGLPDVDEWDAEYCNNCGGGSKFQDCSCEATDLRPTWPSIREAWAEFERRTKEIAQDTLYRFAWMLAENVYLPEKEAKEDAEKDADARAALYAACAHARESLTDTFAGMDEEALQVLNAALGLQEKITTEEQHKTILERGHKAIEEWRSKGLIDYEN